MFFLRSSLSTLWQKPRLRSESLHAQLVKEMAKCLYAVFLPGQLGDLTLTSVFHCCITDQDKHSTNNFQMHACIRLGFWRSEVWHSMAEFSAQGMAQPQSGIGQAEFSSRGAGEKSAFKPFLVGRSQLLVVVGLSRLLSVWLSQESCAQLLNLTPVSFSVAPPLLSCKWYVESFPLFKFLTFSSATSWRNLSTFKGHL